MEEPPVREWVLVPGWGRGLDFWWGKLPVLPRHRWEPRWVSEWVPAPVPELGWVLGFLWEFVLPVREWDWMLDSEWVPLPVLPLVSEWEFGWVRAPVPEWEIPLVLPRLRWALPKPGRERRWVKQRGIPRTGRWELPKAPRIRPQYPAAPRREPGWLPLGWKQDFS